MRRLVCAACAAVLAASVLALVPAAAVVGASAGEGSGASGNAASGAADGGASEGEGAGGASGASGDSSEGVPGLPGAISGTWGTGANASTLTVTWTSPGGSYLEYDVRYRVDSGTVYPSPGHSTTNWMTPSGAATIRTEQKAITGLTSTTTYVVAVRARDRATGRYGGWAISGLIEPTGTPGRPSGISETARSATSLSLRWSRVASGVQGYDVRVSENTSPRSWATVLSGVAQPGSGATVSTTVTSTNLPSGFSSAKTYVAQVRARSVRTGTCGTGSAKCSRWVASGPLAQLDIKGLSAAKMARGSNPTYVRTPSVDMDMRWDKSSVEGASYEVAFYYRVGDPAEYYGVADTNTTPKSRPDSWRMDWDWWNLCEEHDDSVPSDVSEVLSSRGCADHRDRATYYMPFWSFGRDGWGSWVSLSAADAGCGSGVGSVCSYTFADVTTAKLTSKVRVRAVAGGTKGPVSEFTSLPARTPYAPYDLAATAPTGASFEVCWNRGFHRGSALVGFDVQLFDTTAPATATETVTGTWGTQVPDKRHRFCYTFHGVTTSATYYAKVRSQNGVGHSGWAQSDNVTLAPTAPAAPLAPTLSTLTTTSVTLSWSAPVDDGGSAVTGYGVQYRTQNADGTWPSTWTAHTRTGTGTTTTEEVTGLTAGNTYQFAVRAGNASGSGGSTAWSDWSGPLTQAFQLPTASAPTLTSGNAQLGVAWAAAAGNGSTVVDYDVRHCDASTGCDAASEWTDNRNIVKWEPSRTNNLSSNASTGQALDLGNVSLSGITVTKVTTGGISNVYELGTAVGGLYIKLDASDYNGPSYQARYAATAPTTSNMATHGTQLWSVSPGGTGSFNAGAWTPTPLPSGTHFWVAANGNGDSDFSDRFVWAHAASTALTDTITGLTNGTAYEVQVRAASANGYGPWSASATATAGRPAAPAAPTLSAGGTSLGVSWTAPSTHGLTVTGYGIEYSDDSGVTYRSWPHSGTGTSATITGLTAGTEYQVRVRAATSAGWSAWSPTASLKPGVPAPPTNLSSSSGNAQLTVGWTAAQDHGSTVTDYDVQHRACTNSSDLTCGASPAWGDWTDRASETASDTAVSATATGLTNGTAYQVRVRAANSVGEGLWSLSHTDIPGRPPAPAAPSVTPGARKLDLSWTAPTANGLAVTDYDVQYRVTDTDTEATGDQPGAWTEHSHTGTGTTASITGLAALEEYDVQVRAESSAGEGPWSASASGTTAAAKPDAPARPALTSGASSLTVSWTAPNSHGSAITGYGVQYRACTNSSDLTCATNATWASSWTSHTHTGTGTTATIGTLTASTAYQVQVQATNSVGTSGWSATATRVVGAPGSVTGLTAAGSDASLLLSWTAPADNGATVDDYDIRYRQVGAANWTRVLAEGVSGNLPHGAEASDHLTNPVNWASLGSNFTNETLSGNSGVYKVKAAIDEWMAYFGASYTKSAHSGMQACLRTSATKPTANLYTTGTELACETVTDGATHSQLRFGSHISSGTALPAVAAGAYVWMATSQNATSTALRARSVYNVDLQSSATSDTLGGLTNGTAYQVQVRAGNSRGDGEWSATATGTPSVDPPDAVTAPTLASDDRQITASWTAPGDNGSAVFDYDVRHRAQGTTTWTEHFDKVSYSPARRHDVASDGSAGNALDLGTISLTGVTVTEPTISGVSNVYRLGTAVGGLRLAIWGQSDNKPTYQARYAKTAPSSSNMMTHGTRLWSNSTYLGTGTFNSVYACCDGWTPAVPSGTYFWIAPSGADSVDFFDVTVEADTASTTLSRTLAGLTNGTAYEVQVRAGNANGDGAWSASSTIKAGLPDTADAPALEAGGGGVTNGTSLTATWTAPSGNGSALTGYGVRYSADSGATWQTATHSGTTASAAITGLTGTTAYVVQVRAVSSVGNGPWSASSPARKPGAPATVAAPTSESGDAQLTVRWDAPTNHGSAVTDYDVRYRACTNTSDLSCGASPSWGAWTDRTGETAADTARSATLSSPALTNGTAYEVQVRAANSVGEGAWSPAVTDRPGRPPAPSAPTVTAGARQLAVSWTAPAANGLAVTDYDVQYRVADTDSVQSGDQPGDWTALTGAADPGTSVSATISDLTALEEYDVQVRASSSAGAGPWSASTSQTTTAGAPDAPAAPTVLAGGTQISVSWSAPAETHGSTITDYDVRYCDVSTGCDASTEWTARPDTGSDATDTSTSATLTGLTAAKTYVVQVRAGAGALDGNWSASSDAIAAGAPTNPTGISASGRDGSLTVAWTAPTSGNGATVNDYDIRYRQVGTANWTRVLSPGVGFHRWNTGTDASNNTDDPLDWGDWGSNFTKESLGSNAGLYKANSAIDEMWAFFSIPYRYASGLTARLCSSSTKPTGNLYTTTSPCTLHAERTAQANSVGSTYFTVSFGNSSSGVRLADIPQNGYVWMATSEAKTTLNLRERQIFSMDLRSTDLFESVGGLTNGTSYEVQVRAGNSRGNGAWSATATGTPSNAAPSAPAAPTLASGNAQITATWSASSSGAPYDYDVQYRVQNTSNWTEHRLAANKVAYRPATGSWANQATDATSGTALSLGTISLSGVTVTKPTISGVSNVYRLGTDVGGLRIRLHGVAEGTSPWPLYQARYASTAPSSSNMASHGTRLWSAQPVNPVGRFTGDAWSTTPLPSGTYFWVAADSNNTFDYDSEANSLVVEAEKASTTLSRTITGLSNNTSYEVRVRAENANGSSAWSASSTVKAGLPVAPDAPRLEAGGGGVTNGTSLTASWTAPSGRGNPITDYDVRYSSDSGATWTEWNAGNSSTATSASITGLTGATAYLVQVRAATLVGESPWSASSAARKPGAPATVATPTSSSGNATLTVRWEAPTNHGSAVTDYDVQHRACTNASDLSCGASPAWGAWTDRSGETGADTTRSATLSALTNGTAYQVRVRAANSVGEGAWSAAVADLPGRPPAPAAPTVTAGARQLSVTWTAPAANGLAVTDYDVQYRVADTDSGQTGDQPGDWTAHSHTGLGTSATITLLTAGEEYDVQVRASSSAGAGPWSASTSQTTSGSAPDAPAAPTVVPGGTQITVSWTAPATHGAAIDDYDVRHSSDSGATWTTLDDSGSNASDTGTSETITGLTASTTYVVQVRAGAGALDSAWSASSHAVAAGAPTVPRTVSAAGGDQSLSVTWTAPSADNNAAVSDYDVRWSSDSGATWTELDDSGSNGTDTSLSATVSGLTNGTAHEVQVRAGNSNGDGPWSASATGTPTAPQPSAPAAPTLVSGNRQITASWAAPAVNGTAVIDYDVRHRVQNNSTWTEHFDTVLYAPDGLGPAWDNVPSDASAGSALNLGTISLTGVTVTKPTLSGVSNVYLLGTAVGGLRLEIAGLSDHRRQYQARYASTAPSSSNMATHGTRVWANTPPQGSFFGPDRSGGGFDGWTPALPSGTYFWIAADSSDEVDFLDPEVEADTASTALSRAVTGLVNNTAYEVQVRAGNAHGDGPWSPGAVIKAGLPAAPDAPSLDAGGGGATDGTSLTAAWDAASGNGNTVIDYDLQYSTDSGATWTEWDADNTSTTPSVAMTGLTASTEYLVQARGVNSVGNGPWSASSEARKPGAPATPAAPTSSSGNASLTIRWTAPAGHGSAITDYDVQYRACTNSSDLSCATSPSWGAWTARTGETAADTALTATLSTLTNDTAYEVQVRAGNSIGESAWASVTDRPGRPPAPGAPTLTAGTRQLGVAWSAPTANGSAITDYDVQYRITDTDSVQSGNQPGVWTALTGGDDPGTSTSATISNLTALEQYDVQVRASSAAGAGPWSVSASETAAAGVPNAPAAPTLEAGNAQMSVSWTAPGDNGSAITDYDVRYCDTSTGCDAANEWTALDDNGTNATDTGLSDTITGLTNGTTYVVQVRAGNSVGDGAWSASSDAVAAGAPANPGSVSATAGDAKLTVTWAAPTANNGDNVNDYDVRIRRVGTANWTRVLSSGAGHREWGFLDYETSNNTDNPLDWGSWGANFTQESLGSHTGLYKANSHIDEMWVFFYIAYANASGLKARLCTSTSKPTGNLYTTTSPCTLVAERTAAHYSGAVYRMWFGSGGSGDAVRLADIAQNSYVWMAISTEKQSQGFRRRTVFDMDLRSTTLSEEVTGLTNGTAYEVSVRAGNARGNGAWSAPHTATPTAS